ncbi:MAG: response regulator [Clostridiales Family XIII bacterium]|jgi:signal transduction histidine kinase/ActR/RegA family two-component response regulator|nr:response regulator [Clostridiales Family XIII bacterium]
MTTDNKDILAEENRLLVRENKRLQRALARQEELVRRNKVTMEARKQFNDIVKSERSRLELNMNLLLANIRDYILFFDTSGRLQYCSESFLQALDVPGTALIKDKRMSELMDGIFPQENIDLIIGLARSFAKGEPARNLEMSMRIDLDRNGIFRDYLVEVNILINDEGGSEGFVMLFYDTTELMDARREAEKANAVKSDFLATVSHEIRTPMNAVIGLTDMIEETDLDVRQEDLVAKIKSSSTNLLGIINDLLDFSKIEAGKVEIINEYFDLLQLIDEVKSLFSLMMAEKDLAFICDFADDLPKVIYSDGKRVRQIMVNLLNNAYKYTPQGSVTFKIHKLTEDTLGFSVTDTGIGIKEGEQYKLFREFEQLDQVRNKHITGTGLGLAITKRLCDLMGGSINVESIYGEGSTFSVVLPLTIGTTDDLPHGEAKAPKFTAPGARILIVDDVEINLEITRFMLESFLVQTDVALDGEKALALLAKEHFDLVLMDHMMPVMDGIEATRIIRKREQEQEEQTGQPGGHLPVVALTANAITGVEEMFRREGFDGFISKPIDADNLAWTLYELLPHDLIDIL